MSQPALRRLLFIPSLQVFSCLSRLSADAVEHGVVLCGMAGAFAIKVFSKTDIEGPVQFVFDAPVLSDGAVQPRRVGLEAGDVEAGLALGLARDLVTAFRFDAYQAL